MYCIHLLSYDLWALCPQSVESSDHINIEHVYSGYVLPQAGLDPPNNIFYFPKKNSCHKDIESIYPDMGIRPNPNNRIIKNTAK